MVLFALLPSSAQQGQSACGSDCVFLLQVGLDGVSVGCNSDCSFHKRSSFRLLPDQRIQNLYSGFCFFQSTRIMGLSLRKCSAHALHFALDEGDTGPASHCPPLQPFPSQCHSTSYGWLCSQCVTRRGPGMLLLGTRQSVSSRETSTGWSHPGSHLPCPSHMAKPLYPG